MQDERWEFDLDLPRSETANTVCRVEVERDWWDHYCDIDRKLRVWIGPPRRVRR
jgi:hypothetical protein